MRVLHAGPGAAHQMDDRSGQRLTRAEIARLIDGHLCRCTGYTKIIDAVELIQAAKLGGGALPAIVEDGGVGTSLRRYQGAELALGAAAVRRRHRGARPALRRRRPVGACARPHRAHRRLQGARAAGRRRGRDRRGRAGRPLGRPDLCRLARLRRRRRGGALRRRRARGGRRRHAAPRPRGRGAGRGRIRAAAAGARPRRGDQAGRAAGQSQARQCALDHPLRARRRRGRVRRFRACRHGHMDDSAHRAPVPRAGGVPGPAAAGRAPACLQPGPGDFRGSPADRLRARRAGGARCSSNWSRTAAPSAARRT